MYSRLFLLVLLGCSSFVMAQGTSHPLVSSLIYLDVAQAGDRLVAVGDRGTIVYSKDGTTWQRASTPENVLLTAVYFVDDTHGWAVGHDAVVLHSTDGGVTWALQYSDPLGGDGADDTGQEAAQAEYGDDYADDEAYSYDNDYDYADEAGYDDRYEEDAYAEDGYAEDGYADYGYDDVAVDTSGAPLLDVYFFNRNKGFAVGGYGYFLKTENGGKTWEKSSAINNPDGWHLNALAVSPVDERTVFAVGEKGLIFRSRDGGNSWEKLDSPYPGSFFGVSALDEALLLVYGLQGNLWVSRDQGDTWARIETGEGRGLNDATRLGDGSVLVVGNAGVLLRSFDHGDSFSLHYTRERESISAVAPLDAQRYIIVGEGGIDVKSAIGGEQ